MKHLRKAIAFFVAAGIIVLTGCGQQLRGLDGRGQPELSFPSQILGLKVQSEQPTKSLSQVKRPYFSQLGLFSLRDGDLLRASLEIARFNSVARPGSPKFREQLLQGIGTKAPRKMRVGDQVVYATAGNRQNIFVWFKNKGMLVLVTHQNYSFPRTLLRRVISLDLEL